MDKDAYIIVQAPATLWDTYIDTSKLTKLVNDKKREGYEVSGGINFESSETKKIILFQPMTLNPSQGGGNGTKRRRIRKNARTYNRIRQ